MELNCSGIVSVSDSTVTLGVGYNKTTLLVSSFYFTSIGNISAARFSNYSDIIANDTAELSFDNVTWTKLPLYSYQSFHSMNFNYTYIGAVNLNENLPLYERCTFTDWIPPQGVSVEQIEHSSFIKFDIKPVYSQSSYYFILLLFATVFGVSFSIINFLFCKE